MRLGPKILAALSLLLAALGCWLAATVSANVIENRSTAAVSAALASAGHNWTDVASDGLQVHVAGIAPSEASRFNAIHVAGTIVDATRVVDEISVEPSKPLAAPDFSLEILRNDEGVTMIGLVPDSLDREAMKSEIAALAQGAEVIDLLETTNYPAGQDWDDAFHFGLNALARFERAKISIAPGRVGIDAISDSEKEKRALEAQLTRRVPKGLELSYDISAPRPVITPFTLRFLIDTEGARFDACSVSGTKDRDRVLEAARAAGLSGDADCTIGLGVPSPEWANAVVQSIGVLADLGGGSVTFSDADITLVAQDTTPRARFDQAVGELESNLPDVFTLHSVLPEPVAAEGGGEDEGPAEFIATRSPEGQVELRGRLRNEMVRETVNSFARARFGVGSVHMAARTDNELPAEWTIRVLTALQALGELANGSAVVRSDFIEISGVTGNPDGQAEVTRILAEKLGESQNFRISVTYDQKLDPVAALPKPEECIGQIDAILAQSKIAFEPGSADLSGEGVRVVNEIADILKACRDVDMQIEIAGHTDSQGREEMNLRLSQERADAVQQALMARRVLVSKIEAQGYGEAEPIADNGTEEGREANRRIEFRLLGDTPEATVEGEAGAGEGVEPATTGDADAAVSETALDATSGAADSAASGGASESTDDAQAPAAEAMPGEGEEPPMEEPE